MKFIIIIKNMKIILFVTLTYILQFVSAERFLDSILVEEAIPNGPLYTKTIAGGPEFTI